MMTSMPDRLDALGRLFFRALGSLCVLAVLGALAGIAWTLSNWNGPDTAVGLGMLLFFAGLMAWSAAHCFSRKRTLVEALDAMEGVPLDPRPPERERSP